MPFALSGVSVLETGGSPSVAFAGRLLRGLGASVVSLDPPPFVPQLDPTLAAFLADDKQRLPFDRPLAEVLPGVAIWLDGRPAEEIRATLGDAPAGVVHVAITPFGLEGPWAERAGSGIVASALGGFLHICGDSSREPLKNGGFVVEFQTGLFAVAGALAGLLHREASGQGLLVETSLLESVVAFQERADIAWTHQGMNWRRARRHEVGHPFTIFPSADGYVSIAVGTPRHWTNLCLLIGQPGWAEDVELTMNRHANADLIDTALVPWLQVNTSAEIVRRCQELFIPCGPVLTPSQVLADAHLRARNFFRSFEAPGGKRLTVPGHPFRSSLGWDEDAPGAAG